MAQNRDGRDYLPVNVLTAIKRAFAKRGLQYQKRAKKESETDVLTLNPKLEQAVSEGHEILFKADTVFPLTLFPDTVTLDREKVTFTNRIFFFMAKVTSVSVRDILNVDADIGPFFGSVHTSSRYFIKAPITVNFLWRKDAIKLQRLLQGYIIVHEKELDVSAIKTEELGKFLSDLGQGES